MNAPDYDQSHKLNALLNRASAEDLAISLAYFTLLRLPVTHPFRLANQSTYGACVNYLALALNQDPQWVQEAFEQRVRDTIADR